MYFSLLPTPCSDAAKNAELIFHRYLNTTTTIHRLFNANNTS